MRGGRSIVESPIASASAARGVVIARTSGPSGPARGARPEAGWLTEVASLNDGFQAVRRTAVGPKRTTD